MEVRKFKISNGLGQEYELTSKNYKAYLNTPNGLGFSKQLSTIRIGDELLVNSSRFEMAQPTGELLFKDRNTAYQDYADFIKFISYKPLILYYTPSNVVTPYYVECDILSLEKSEISPDDKMLHCPIVIIAKTMWQQTSENEVITTNTIAPDGKHYPLVRPYHYAGSSLTDIEIDNQGTLDSGFKLEINGYCENPQINAFDENGNKYGVVKILGNYDYVRVNTNDTKQEIYLEYEGSTIANPTAYQDLTIADGNAIMTFFKLKVGISKLVFSCGNFATFDGEVRIAWENSYYTV